MYTLSHRIISTATKQDKYWVGSHVMPGWCIYTILTQMILKKELGGEINTARQSSQKQEQQQTNKKANAIKTQQKQTEVLQQRQESNE